MNRIDRLTAILIELQSKRVGGTKADMYALRFRRSFTTGHNFVFIYACLINRYRVLTGPVQAISINGENSQKPESKKS